MLGRLVLAFYLALKTVQQILTALKRDNVNVHRAAARIIVFKSRAARGSVCNVLLCGVAMFFASKLDVCGV